MRDYYEAMKLSLKVELDLLWEMPSLDHFGGDAQAAESPRGTGSRMPLHGVNGADKLGHWGRVTVYHRPDGCRSKSVRVATLQE